MTETLIIPDRPLKIFSVDSGLILTVLYEPKKELRPGTLPLLIEANLDGVMETGLNRGSTITKRVLSDH